MLLNNRYRIIRTLGSGGFGKTFLAEDSQIPSCRLCVIKQLRPIQNNPQIYELVQQRFAREAAILEELGDGSSQIPRLYAYFSEHGQFYLVQEYVEGKTLTQILQELGLMDENSVKGILIGILPVLEYVHSKGIVHRDIKPENILIDVENKPVLIDFGAVKETLSTMMTTSGNATKSIVIGTPGFMSTEQSIGRPMFVSDIYSLGLTAIYLLTGKMPQELATEPATGKILWRQYAPNVKNDFANILDRAIGFDARERFKSASVMLQALQTGVLSVPSGVSHITRDTVPPGITLPPQTYLSTISIAPPSSIAYGRQGSGKGILFGSLIAGSLIGASILIGFTLYKQPQVTQQPQPSASPQKTPENLNINQQKNIPTPTVTPTVKPTLTVPPAIEPNETLKIEPPITAQPPQIANPNPDPPILRETPLSPPIEFTSPIQRSSPAQAVENYYSIINQGQYKTAWNQLSPEYKDNKRFHPNGYFSYLSWWKGKVESVDIQQVSVLEANQDTAIVDASLNYSMKNGRIVLSSVRFFLVWDAQNSRWMVKDAN
ncbi:protein kinase domain-containing protein [Rivularia sp. UHCC 0363]|uniref:protein kinase domain-containing protein n=1 Tax=Rivularia sp. UHCC 0363 TaxID=3110244 RepID=UPI002B206045|nr:protein kinase [Rivularia sp. UHCC 0363]MEA5596678.1 protein kinase [Rivularia sp. UHCC 0363]